MGAGRRRVPERRRHRPGRGHEFQEHLEQDVRPEDRHERDRKGVFRRRQAGLARGVGPYPWRRRQGGCCQVGRGSGRKGSRKDSRTDDAIHDQNSDPERDGGCRKSRSGESGNRSRESGHGREPGRSGGDQGICGYVG